MGKLTALKIKSLKEPGRYSDGDGLFLDINGKGGASWILRVQTAGKRKDIGLGSAKAVSLADARDAAFITRKKLAQGVDPVAERKQERQAVPTFRDAADMVHKEHQEGWKNGKRQKQWLATLETYAYPSLGSRLVSEIEGPAVRDVLAPIWLSKPETARRVRQRIGTVLDWAYAKGFRSSEAPMRSLSKGLPRQPKKDGHFAAMSYAQLPAFLTKLRERESVARLALEALILTAARSGEIRGAEWTELDLDAGLWTVPASRMKMGRAHTQAFALQLERHGDTCWHLHKAIVRPSENFDRKTFQQWAAGAKLPNAVQSFNMLARVEHRYRLPPGYFRGKLTNTGRAVVGHQLVTLPASERRRLAWHLPEDFDQRPPVERAEILDWIRSVIISGSTDYRRYQAEAMKVRYSLRFPEFLTVGTVSGGGAGSQATGAGLRPAPARLVQELGDLIRFKTATLTKIGRRSQPQFEKPRHTSHGGCCPSRRRYLRLREGLCPGHWTAGKGLRSLGSHGGPALCDGHEDDQHRTLQVDRRRGGSAID